MDQYQSEILEQPSVLRRIYDNWTQNDELLALGARYRVERPRLIFVGMGSSHYAPTVLRARFSRAHIDFQILEAGELLHYELDNIPESAWVIAISQSGESIETKAVVEAVKGKVAHVVAITNESDSTLAKLADTPLFLLAGKEVGSTTKTYINTLLGLHLFANVIEDNTLVTREDVEQLSAIFTTHNDVLREKMKEVISALDVSSDNTPDPIHFIARGQMLATAQQSALILSETADLYTQGFSGGTFRHGPYELAGENHRAIVFAPAGKTQQLLINMARELAERGSKVVLISDTQEQGPFFTLTLPAVSEELAALLYFLPIEWFGWNLSLLRGRTPGMMRNMGKVTMVE